MIEKLLEHGGNLGIIAFIAYIAIKEMAGRFGKNGASGTSLLQEIAFNTKENKAGVKSINEKMNSIDKNIAGMAGQQERMHENDKRMSFCVEETNNRVMAFDMKTIEAACRGVGEISSGVKSIKKKLHIASD